MLRRPLASGVLGLCALVLVASCGDSERKAADEAGQVRAQSLLESSQSPPLSASAQFNCPLPVPLGGSLNLVIDASRSMAGFTGSPGQVTAFDNIIDRLSVDWGSSTVMLFGEQSGGSLITTAPLGPAVHEPSGYRRLQNPDYCLIQGLDSLSADAVVAYVTDGVQSSAQYGNPSPTVRKLKDWLAAGRALEILAFESEFNGPAWSEQQGRWIGQADVARRPFYVFMMSYRQETLDAAVDRLSPTIRSTSTRIRFPPQPVGCRVQVVAHTQFSAPSGMPYAFITSQVRNQFFATASDTVALYRCEIAQGYPVAGVAVRPSVSYARWDPGTQDFVNANPPASADFRTDLRLTQGVGAAVVAQLPATTAGAVSRFGFYHIRLVPEVAEIRSDIARLSTDSDAAVDSFDRTYRFDWLVEHLARAHFGGTVDPKSFFLIVEQTPL